MSTPSDSSSSNAPSSVAPVCAGAPLSRRNFLQTAGVGIAGAGLVAAGATGIISLTPVAPPIAPPTEAAGSAVSFKNAIVGKGAGELPRVRLGNTGITTSMLAFGTGVHGYNKSSELTRPGLAKFVTLARHAHERGIRFYDMADSYGSQPFVAQALKYFPRDELTLSSKIWTEDDSQKLYRELPATIDRMLRELETDRLEILLMHCLLAGGWNEKRQQTIAAFQRAKAAGKVRAIGVSCHNWDAMVEAVNTPWVDVILARINPFGTMMDNKPPAVKALLQKALANGKAVIAMKVFGEGKRVKENEREQSIRYVLHEVGIPCMTIGMTTSAQVDDAVARVRRIAGEKI